MKTLCILLFCFLAVSVHAAPLSVLSFKSNSIDIYKADGSRMESINTKELGPPENLVLKEILDNGLCVLQSANKNFIVDPFDLKLPPGTTLNKEDLKAYAGQGFDNNSFGVNGIGGD